MDATDREIIKWLMQNARLLWKEIGEQVHLTGQAVGARIQKLIGLQHGNYRVPLSISKTK